MVRFVLAFFKERESIPPSPPVKTARPSSSANLPSSSANLEEKRLKSLYRTYLSAKKKCNEPTENISYEKISSMLNKKYKSKDGNVDFKVAIRKGKAILKTVKKD